MTASNVIKDISLDLGKYILLLYFHLFMILKIISRHILPITPHPIYPLLEDRFLFFNTLQESMTF